ncbi:MAG: hypothetical protein AAFV96_12390, partial [Pseudomonadota bacterium]
MTDLSDAFSADWQRRLRFPAWRPLVLSLSIMGAVIILTASYYRTSITAADRLAEETAADAALLAEALQRDAARAVPLAALAASVAENTREAGPAPLARLAAGSSAAALALYAPAPGDAAAGGEVVIALRPVATARGPDGAALPEEALVALAARALAEGRANASLPLMSAGIPDEDVDGAAATFGAAGFLLAAAQRVEAAGRPAVAVAALRPVAFEAAARGMEGEAVVASIAAAPADPRLAAVAEGRSIAHAAPVDDLGLAVTITRSTRPVRERAATVVSIEIMVMAL